YPQGIDLWARIFLIDVTNEQASERIEKAKSKNRDVEQRSENLVTAGVQAFDRGDRDAAKENFDKVLQIDPHNPAALDYMERLSQVVTEGRAAGLESK